MAEKKLENNIQSSPPKWISVSYRMDNPFPNLASDKTIARAMDSIGFKQRGPGEIGEQRTLRFEKLENLEADSNRNESFCEPICADGKRKEYLCEPVEPKEIIVCFRRDNPHPPREIRDSILKALKGEAFELVSEARNGVVEAMAFEKKGRRKRFSWQRKAGRR
jgi:hypothetical protein